jgi:hypothetical protein
VAKEEGKEKDQLVLSSKIQYVIVYQALM